ncbi:MAG: serine/threonine-protein kinase [bacterium]
MNSRAAAGTVIEGKYRLERELGAGGMGAVWLATQVMVDRKVAVKLLHPAFLDQQDLQARFEVEARAIGRLNHPNCITLFDFGFSPDLGAFYTVIEYVNGQSLDKRLGTLMPIPEVISIIRQVALALDHAHHQGILHRDLKPENVMLAQMTDGSELVKVLDFGIARIVKGDADSEEAQRITKAGEVFGTPAYMSPEQARSTRQLGPPADLYGLGVMFYELVAGKLPFFSNSAFDLLMMHVTKPVPPITRSDVSDDLKAIILKLLEKEPEKRFQTGRELAKALDTVTGSPSTDELVMSASRAATAPIPTMLGLDEPAYASPNASAEIPTTTYERYVQVTEPPPAKSKAPILIGIVGVLSILAVMAVIVWAVEKPSTPETDTPPIQETIAETAPKDDVVAPANPAPQEQHDAGTDASTGDVGAPDVAEPPPETKPAVTTKKPKKTTKPEKAPDPKPIKRDFVRVPLETEPERKTPNLRPF